MALFRFAEKFSDYCLVTAFEENMDLKTFMTRSSLVYANSSSAHSLTESEQLLVTRQVLQGLLFLSTRAHILHLQLSAQHVLVGGANLAVKVTNFASAHDVIDRQRRCMETGVSRIGSEREQVRMVIGLR